MRITVESVLAPVHDRWMNEVRRCIEPATSETAELWDRWAAVRYLADQFRSHFRLERALLDAVAAVLPPDDAEQLTGQAGDLEELLARIDHLGRRQGTASAVAADTRRLLVDLSAWCAGLERAVGGLPRSAIPGAALRALQHVASSGTVAISAL